MFSVISSFALSKSSTPAQPRAPLKVPDGVRRTIFTSSLRYLSGLDVYARSFEVARAEGACPGLLRSGLRWSLRSNSIATISSPPSGLYTFFLTGKTITVQVATSPFPSSLCFSLRHVACRHLRKGLKDRERLYQKSYLAFKANKREGMGELKGTAGTGHNDNTTLNAGSSNGPENKWTRSPYKTLVHDGRLFAAYFGSCIVNAQPHTQQTLSLVTLHSFYASNPSGKAQLAPAITIMLPSMPDPPMGRRINGLGPLTRFWVPMICSTSLFAAHDRRLSAAYFGSCIASAQPHTQQDNAGQVDFIKESRDVGEGIGYLRLLVWYGIV
ncbi:hypothetical protein BDQ17DRAFT_1333894 [Cyathus striatus]|nr:hypothetical protein BDQ17DRAFT_1333894 [Cyathus striatus]